jgi:hypothetical protein
LTVKKFTAELHDGAKATRVQVTLDDKLIPCSFAQAGARCDIVFNEPASLKAHSILVMTIS